jgi:hypothetical protein
MQLYAFIDTDNIVVQVIEGRAVGEVIDGISDWEAHYSDSFGLTCKRVDMSDDANYPSIGYRYDSITNTFIRLEDATSEAASEQVSDPA